ncbi:isoleucine--tRNA ligase [Candidatus Uhrbacteria bacterium]|nr:isoleucine--tRNA ligase [Candidatus Uhrbacteria bacterium]
MYHSPAPIVGRPTSEYMSEPTSSRPDFPKMEEEIAAFWKKKEIFERSISERSEKKEFVFYDGPPFATGLPHYGHLLQSAIKDAVPRYWTMKGYRVLRRWGWDCHGLPIENLIEKELKLDSKRDIEGYGIDKFNAACRASVDRYEKEWDRYIKRLGRWVDFERSYKTMDNDYIESVWWVFSELYRKGLVYKDRRVSLYCPRCATPLSNFETAMGDSYETREDPAVTVKFKVRGADKTYLLAWTTTPWTLPANTAIAAHPDLEYLKVLVSATGETFIFAKDRMNDVLHAFYPLKSNAEVPFETLERLHGSDLVGMEYEPLYSFVPLEKPAHRVVAMDYVSASEGTGLVHTAPAFGEEDFAASKAHDLPVLLTVDEEGRQRPELGDFAGLPVKASNPLIIADLKKRGLLFDETTISHSVPVCWRCNSELLYKAQAAWFVDVTKLKPKLLETAKKITWHPEHFKEGRFGNGLKTAPDWCISRTRYWGAPLPVWECGTCAERRVVGSVAELKKLAAKERVDAKSDLHRPAIDRVVLPCSCGGEMARVPDVFDCWFESGSMPYASAHYPFEKKDWFEEHFPADFIAEAQDQTRGWFYSLHVLATALFGKPAFTDVITTGFIMSEEGKKLSKKLKNYKDSWDIMTSVGADTFRLYLLSSAVVRGEQLNFVEKDCEQLQRAVLGTLWNVRAFYLLYAGDDRIERKKPRSAHILDRWLYARLMTLEKEMGDAMDGYDLVEASRLLRPFIEDLSTWWLRRSRERMKGDDPDERMDALRTLREVLTELALLMAPFTPFFAERLYQDMEGEKMSVHLDRWPKADERLIDTRLLEDMAWVRDAVTEGLEARAVAKLPVRQALGRFSIRFRDASQADRRSKRQDLLALVRDELNVERVEISSGEDGLEESVAWQVTLDTTLTPELRRKGALRELVRQFMHLRKEASLNPADRIVAFISSAGAEEFLAAVETELKTDIRAARLAVGEAAPAPAKFTATVKTTEGEFLIGLEKA